MMHLVWTSDGATDHARGIGPAGGSRCVSASGANRSVPSRTSPGDRRADTSRLDIRGRAADPAEGDQLPDDLPGGDHHGGDARSGRPAQARAEDGRRRQQRQHRTLQEARHRVVEPSGQQRFGGNEAHGVADAGRPPASRGTGQQAPARRLGPGGTPCHQLQATYQAGGTERRPERGQLGTCF